MEEFGFQRSQAEAKRKMTNSDKPLHQIEIIDIDRAQDKVKIHFTDYASEFD